MNILFLTESLSGRDGWSRYALDLSKALSEQGHTVSAAVVEKSNSAEWCTQIEGLRPPLHCLSILGCALQYFRLRRILSLVQPDIVHVIAEPYALLMGFLPKRFAFCLTIHGSYAVIPFRAGLFARFATIRAWRKAKTIIAVSKFTKNYVKQNEPTLFDALRLEEKIRVVENAIALQPQQPKTTTNTVKRILGVGAVKARKGYLQSIRALAELKKKTSLPFRYDIIGSLADTAYVNELKQECAKLGIGDNVHLRGSLPEEQLREAYASADAFLMLSIFDPPYVEGFVLAFLEAAAAGVPSVGPNTGGCPEAIAEGRSGYVCDPNNAGLVAEKLRNILERGSIDPITCRTWAEEHDCRKAAKKIATLYVSH